MKNSDNQYLVHNLLAVGTQNNLGVWTGTGWQNINTGWTIRGVTTDLFGQVYVIGTEYNVGIYDIAESTMKDLGHIGGWQISCVTFDPMNTMWCVGAEGNIGKWNGLEWEQHQAWNSWKIHCLTFDNNGTMWCVGAEGNIGKWNATSETWENQSQFPWLVNSILFDGEGSLWVVGKEWNVGIWNNDSQTIDDKGKLGGWTLYCLGFIQLLSAEKVSYSHVEVIPSSKTTTVSQTLRNDSDATVTETFTHTYSETKTESWTWNNSTTIGVSETTSIHVSDPMVPGISADDSVTMNASDTFQFGGGSSHTVTTTKTYSGTVSVPPNSNIAATLTISTGTVTADMSCQVKYKGKMVTVTGTYQGGNVTQTQLSTHTIDSHAPSTT